MESLGHTFVLACDGGEAVEAWARESFDVVLMDVQMPTIDGFTATARIRDLAPADKLQDCRPISSASGSLPLGSLFASLTTVGLPRWNIRLEGAAFNANPGTFVRSRGSGISFDESEKFSDICLDHVLPT